MRAGRLKAASVARPWHRGRATAQLRHPRSPQCRAALPCTSRSEAWARPPARGSAQRGGQCARQHAGARLAREACGVPAADRAAHARVEADAQARHTKGACPCRLKARSPKQPEPTGAVHGARRRRKRLRLAAKLSAHLQYFQGVEDCVRDPGADRGAGDVCDNAFLHGEICRPVLEKSGARVRIRPSGLAYV
eukprot:768707-Prymnesium_polylepis.1